MVYRAIGLMSGSSLDGLDIVFTEIHASGRNWSYEIVCSACIPYTTAWHAQLQGAAQLSAKEYFLLHHAYGKFIGEAVNDFITANDLEHKVQLVVSHGHTVFHEPAKGISTQLGDGATIAAITGLQVIADLRSMDVALGGQGAPIVPIGEQLLFPGYDYFLNLGGIANLSIVQQDQERRAFDICAANRVLNALAFTTGQPFDSEGSLAAKGNLHTPLFEALNALPYFSLAAPKSLSNGFADAVILPLIKEMGISVEDALHTFVHHICHQIAAVVTQPGKMMLTGGGAFNSYLVQTLEHLLAPKGVNIVIPEPAVVHYKEALIMALIGLLRWRQEENVLSTVTGASKDSVGGALWCGN